MVNNIYSSIYTSIIKINHAILYRIQETKYAPLQSYR